MFTRKLLNLFLLFFIWRIFLFIIAFLAIDIIPVWGDRFPYKELHLSSSGLPYWLWSWGNFDGVHYLNIAKNAYSAYYTQTFFPFYPLIIRFLAKILFDNFLVSALIVSNLSFFGCLYFLKKLLIFDGLKNNSFWIILILLFFPTSFYFGSVYTESLFLLLILTSFYFARKSEWFLAGLTGAIASFTRLFGILMLPALLVEYFKQHKKNKKRPQQIFFIFFVPLGLILYMLYLKVKFNDPLLFWHAQPVFGAERIGQGFILPPQVIYRYFKILLTVEFISLPFWNALFEIASFIFTVLILVIAHIKKVRPSYLTFSWLSLILPSLTGTFSSLPRYILIIFPIYIVLGSLKNKLIKIFLLFLNIIILTITTILFTRGYWVA